MQKEKEKRTDHYLHGIRAVPHIIPLTVVLVVLLELGAGVGGIEGRGAVWWHLLARPSVVPLHGLAVSQAIVVVRAGSIIPGLLLALTL
ncbi:hypothetical protein CEXT_2321 [Caerostris extrusa]|uniref:ABC transporter permease n=1 Tax=Caerostris extrusa TaxID=172846 RepID=A0AAV4QYE8_CAEEX|nr:hypothetical protein CEXT_2321 [Caerostris extrusa]